MESKNVLLFCLLLATVYARQSRKNVLADVLEDVFEQYQDYKKEKQMDSLQELIDREDEKKYHENYNYDPVNPNLQMCHGVGLDCEHCGGCYPGGWCVKPKNDGKPKCLCNYGWTGPQAIYVPNTNDPGWGKNRIRAGNCLTPCHYTHHVRNLTCLHIATNPTAPHPICHHKCGKYQGTCENGRCKCCRGWAGPNKHYNAHKDTYYADYCDQECPYLGEGVENPHCTPHPVVVPECNPHCVKSDGKCVENGRCLCCLGWTGPGAHHGKGKYDGKILADYCDVYCPYTAKKRNDMCVIPDYVNRRRAAGHKIDYWI